MKKSGVKTERIMGMVKDGFGIDGNGFGWKKGMG